MAPLQNRMPLHQFVVASVPGASERDYLESIFKCLRDSGTRKDSWVLVTRRTVGDVSAKDFVAAYLDHYHDPLFTSKVTNALSPYFKAGVVTLLLRLWSDL